MKSVGISLTELEAALQYFFFFFLRWYRETASCSLRRCTIDLLPEAIFSFMQHEMERIISLCVSKSMFFFFHIIHVFAFFHTLSDVGTWVNAVAHEVYLCKCAHVCKSPPKKKNKKKTGKTRQNWRGSSSSRRETERLVWPVGSNIH